MLLGMGEYFPDFSLGFYLRLSFQSYPRLLPGVGLSTLPWRDGNPLLFPPASRMGYSTNGSWVGFGLWVGVSGFLPLPLECESKMLSRQHVIFIILLSLHLRDKSRALGTHVESVPAADLETDNIMAIKIGKLIALILSGQSPRLAYYFLAF